MGERKRLFENKKCIQFYWVLVLVFEFYNESNLWFYNSDRESSGFLFYLNSLL